VYAQFFNLREMPFAITPDPAYLFLSPRHQEALGHLLYGTGQYGGFVQLTGEVGTGKTTIVRTLLEQKLEGVDVAMIHNPSQNEIEFVQSICDELRIDYPKTKAAPSLKRLVDALNQHLLTTHAAGRRTVLIIDEAQNLPRDVLEQVRLLTNLETHKEKLLRIMLIGQPELIELLSRPDLRQLASRITARYHLVPLTEPETGDYIRHRLRVAGTHEELFPAAAIREVHRHSRGVPRLINVLCDRALLGAYASGQRRVTADIVRKAAAESLGSTSAASIAGPRWQLPRLKKGLPLKTVETALIALTLVIVGALLYQTFVASPSRQEAAAASAAAPEVAVETGSETMTEPKPAASAPIAGATAETDITPTVTLPAASGPALAADISTLLQAGEPLGAVMGRLIRLWDTGLVVPAGANVCKTLSQQRLECFKDSGTWADLRQLNRPALLSLANGRGEQQHVLVTALDTASARIETALGPLTVRLEQLDALWTGEFLLLWRRETEDSFLKRGSRGPSVVWLRQRLAELEGREPAKPLSDQFGPELAEQLKAFQAREGLDADGVLGVRTLIALGDHGNPSPTLLAERPNSAASTTP
jgi:general secretion pathway protein A